MEREMEEEAEQEEKEEEEMASEDDVEEEKEEEDEKQEDAKIKEEEEKQEEEKANEEEEQPTRKRSSEAIDTTGDASVEPPTKQIRASHAAEVDPDLDPVLDLAPIQPGPPKQPPFDRSALDARCVLRQHFYHVVHQLLPSMVARLMNVWQRSEAGEFPRFGLVRGPHGRPEHFIRMTLADVDMVALTRQLIALSRAARVLHQHLVTTGPVDDAAQTDLNALRLERVNSCANRLAEKLQMATYMYHDPPHPAEQMTKLRQYVDEIRLTVYQGVFRDLRLRESPLDRQENDPCDLPIRDAWELVKLVCNELSRAIDVADDLSDWLSTYPAAVAGPVEGGGALHPNPVDDEQTVRMDALALVHQLMRFCFEKLTEQLQFLQRRAQLARRASLQPPECFERMEALNRQDSSTRTLWRIYARRLAAQGEQLLLYVHNKIRVLEK